MTIVGEGSDGALGPFAWNEEVRPGSYNAIMMPASIAESEGEGPWESRRTRRSLRPRRVPPLVTK